MKRARRVSRWTAALALAVSELVAFTSSCGGVTDERGAGGRSSAGASGKSGAAGGDAAIDSGTPFPFPPCKPGDADCSSDGECCGVLFCVSGKCGPGVTPCQPLGNACQINAECCPSNGGRYPCRNGRCVAIP